VGNFSFISSEWPTIFADCVRAEGYVISDPRAACVYARRAVEQIVRLVFDVEGFAVPYQDDLAARINDAAFQRRAGVGICQKLNLIRKIGNRAVHDEQPIPSRAALDALRDLQHIVVWTALRYSTHPETVPAGTRFDPDLAKAAAPLTAEQVRQLDERFREQDEAHARELRERDDVAAAKDAEIVELRKKIAAAQAANPVIDDRDYDEATTRTRIIDELLRESGWDLADERDRELPVTGMPTMNGAGFVDYVLWGADGLPLAVIEAKRTSVDPSIGQQQAKLYADCLEQAYGRRPVVFYSNGFQTWLWDDVAGYPPRAVAGFLTRGELELMIRRRVDRQSLADVPVNPAIVERHYQRRAIAAIDDALTARQRAALLVMATGAGKTRTVIALADQLMRAGWVKRVLFLADRTALVKQAAGAFRAHLPDVVTVNLVEEKVADGRVYVATYPTMVNLIEQRDGAERLFGPGFFDLVVIDEAHRSVYQRYRSIFSWFDSLLVGLTATPKDEVDHNTYSLFNLEDGVPTDAYSLDEAVAEGFLVPPRAVSVGTKFLREGIRYEDLSETEKDEWDSIEWDEDGEVPDAVGAEEINRFLFNADTVDKVLATVMRDGHKVAGGDRLGKTIIFAKNQKHAEFISQRFDANYPEYAGHFARVITHSVAYAQTLIDDFSVAEKAPHIAISVDMLDTGIDVPEVVNLVFFKLVRSKTKFWQMIGRGTRLRPNLYGPGEDKTDFYAFDFCGNLEFFSADLPGSEGSLQKSLGERLFETRLGLVTLLDKDSGAADTWPEPGLGEKSLPGLRVDIAWGLHSVVAEMNVHNFLVRPAREWVERFRDWGAWGRRFTPELAGDIARHLAGLPSAARDDDEAAKRFDLLLLGMQLARLENDALGFERLRSPVQQIASSLLTQTAIPSVRAQQALLAEIAGDDWWTDVTLPMLEIVRRRIRSLVAFMDKRSRTVVYADFADTMGDSVVVELPGVTPGTNWERFRAKTRAFLRQHEDNLALQRLRRNIQLTSSDLDELERMLVESGTGTRADLDRAREQAQGLGLFIRSLVGLDRSAAAAAFGQFLTDRAMSASQIRFIELVIDGLTANGVMEPARLYESPFTDHAPHGPETLFTDGQVGAIVAILRDIRSHAIPGEATVA